MDLPALYTKTNIIEQFAHLLDPRTVWLVFGVVILIFIFLSFILLYHWKKYAYVEKTVHKMRTTYFVGSSILIGTTLFFLIMYTYTL